MKKFLPFSNYLSLFIIFMVTTMASDCWSQLAVWNPTGLTNYGPSPWAETTVNPNLTIVGLTRGSAIGTGGSAAANGWGGTMSATAQATAANAISANQFFTFNMKSNADYQMSLSTFDLRYRRSTTGPASGLLQYAVNGGGYIDISTLSFPSTASGGAGITQVSLSGLAALQNLSSTNTVSFRVVLYANSGSGTFYIYTGGTGLTVGGTLVQVFSGPTVTTVDGTATSSSDLDFSGSINANGFSTNTSFEYGITNAYGQSVTATPSVLNSAIAENINISIDQLEVNTQYYFRAVGTVSGTPTNGAGMSVFTLANQPASAVISNSQITSLDLTFDSSTENGNPSHTEYAIMETAGSYVQANGSLGAIPVWRTATQWSTISVSGLSSETQYTFQLKARNGENIETAFGASVSGTTLENASANMSLVAALPSFGNICINSSATQSFTIQAENLDGTYLVVNSASGFTFSNDENGIYTGSLTLTYTGTSLTEQIWVRFAPVAVSNYDTNIAISGGGLAESFLVAASGAGINTAVTVTTGIAGSISSVGVTLAGSTVTGCSEILTYGFEYSTLNNFTQGSGIQILASDLASGSFSQTVSGLSPNTTYYFRAFANDNSGTVYGALASFMTLNITAPNATMATNILQESFTANWDAVAGANGYRLDVSTLAAFGVTVNTSNLIISEYGEGSVGNKKYVEIYNGTGASVNLANYQLWTIANGGTWPETLLNLSGTLANNDTYVVANNATDVIGADLYNTAISNYNGDDAVGIAYNGGSGNTFLLIDAVGTDGIDPGNGWPVAGINNATVDRILTRKPTVFSPNTNWAASAGTDASNSEWIVSAFVYSNTSQTTGLGLHAINNLRRHLWLRIRRLPQHLKW